jgi:hypothetical protein
VWFAGHVDIIPPNQSLNETAARPVEPLQAARHPQPRAADHASTSHTEVVQGARHALAALLQDVGVDHGGGKIVMPEQLLNGVDVGAALEQVRGEGMAKGVGADGFRQTGPAGGRLLY